MLVIQTIFLFLTWGVTALIVAAILLIVLRALTNYMQVNPFGWTAITLRRATEPVLRPMRAILIGFRLDPKVAPVAIMGYIIFGLLSLYTLAIFVRIIFSWIGMSYANRVMRFVVLITEPLLAPLRRSIPPVGMFDISAIVAFVILWVCKAAVAGTLLRKWPVQFF